jgi:hypothetical protein
LLLSDSRVDPCAKDNWAIKIASRHGHVEIVKTLLSDPRVDPSADNNFIIRWIKDNGHHQVVTALLKFKMYC